MKHNLSALFIALLIAPSLSYALFCPKNFNLIKLGDTIESVDAACGAPDKKEEKVTDKPVPQEWDYYINQTIGINTPYQQIGSLKSSFAFNDKGILINIMVNGVGVGGSTACGAPINLGATLEQVKAACGTPSFINKQQPVSSDTPVEKDTTTTYYYSSTPPVTLIFLNGILTDSRQ